MSEKIKAQAEPNKFDLVQDGLYQARLVLAMNFFIRGPLRAFPDEVTAVYRQWLEIAGIERFRFYATETMSKHSKVNSKTFEKLPSWLTEASAGREFVSIELKDGEAYNDTPRWFIKIHSEETKAQDPSFDLLALIQLTCPIDEALEDTVQDYFLRTCRTLPVRYAAAGYAMQTSRYFKEVSQTFAWEKSMFHPGLDLLVGFTDLWAVGLDGVKTVNWLTMVDKTLIDELGGNSTLVRSVSDPMSVVGLPTGIVFRTGPMPQLGDANQGETLPGYRQVHQLLRPLVMRAASRSKSFHVKSDDGTSTERWYTRLDTAQQLADDKYDRELLQSFKEALCQSEGLTALAIAEEEVARHPKRGQSHEHRLKAVLCCCNHGQEDAHRAETALTEALTFAQEQKDHFSLYSLAAQVFLVIGKREQALETLTHLKNVPEWREEALKSRSLSKFARPLIALADDDRFRQAFGWVPLEAMEAYRAAAVIPDLTGFPKLAQAVRSSIRCGQEVFFAQGAGEDELTDTEQALGSKLPSVYRSFLAATNGMVFCHGQERLFSTRELLTHNQNRKDKSDILIGRDLQLCLQMSTDGEASLTETDMGMISHIWKKLDNGLANMLRARTQEMSEIWPFPAK